MGIALSVEDIDSLAKAIAREVVRELTALGNLPAIIKPPDKRSVFQVGPIAVDLERHEATVDGEPIDLAQREFAVLAELARNAGIVLSRETLLEVAWPSDASLRIENNRTVDVHVRRVRQALGSRCDRLETVHGVGYKLRDR